MLFQELAAIPETISGDQSLIVAGAAADKFDNVAAAQCWPDVDVSQRPTLELGSSIQLTQGGMYHVWSGVCRGHYKYCMKTSLQNILVKM